MLVDTWLLGTPGVVRPLTGCLLCLGWHLGRRVEFHWETQISNGKSPNTSKLWTVYQSSTNCNIRGRVYIIFPCMQEYKLKRYKIPVAISYLWFGSSSTGETFLEKMCEILAEELGWTTGQVGLELSQTPVMILILSTLSCPVHWLTCSLPHPTDVDISVDTTQYSM